MNNIKDINLTENDFKLLVEGLDALPEKGIAGELMGELLMSAFAKDDPEAKSKMEMDRAASRLEKEKKKSLLTEEVRMLQGKLIQLKRHLEANNLLSVVHEIIE